MNRSIERNRSYSLIHFAMASTRRLLWDARPIAMLKWTRTRKGFWSTVAICVVGLLLAMPPKPLLAAPAALVPDISVNLGPIAVQLNITQPVAHSGGLFRSTLHVHARDDTQNPAFNADLVASAQAPDVNILVGGFLPAALIVKQDLLAGMTLDQASADAQAKTGVTITFLNDATMAEYGLLVALIALVCMSEVGQIQPGLGDQACAIRANLQTGMTAAGLSPNPPNPCNRGASAP